MRAKYIQKINSRKGGAMDKITKTDTVRIEHYGEQVVVDRILFIGKRTIYTRIKKVEELMELTHSMERAKDILLVEELAGKVDYNCND